MQDGLSVSENRVVTTILDLRDRKQQEAGENCTTRSFMSCIIHGTLSLLSDQGR